MLVAVFAFVLGVATSTAESSDDDNEIPFDVAKIFIALNDTDGDLGIAAFIDGEAWRQLKIFDQNEDRVLGLWASGRLRRQGLTEFAIESNEPSFEEFSAAAFFRRFPEGTYEVEGLSLDGQELEAEVFLSHVLPAPPGNIRVSDQETSDDCDEDPGPVISGPVVISWDVVTTSHHDIGKSGDIEVVDYEVVVETDDHVFSVHLNPDVTEVEVPAAFIAQADAYSIEILVTAANGNRTAAESCFQVE